MLNVQRLFLFAALLLLPALYAEQQRSAEVISLSSDAKIKLKELAFGELLYDYYQENYFAALTRLDVAEYRNEVVEHKQHLRLIRGVMYLSYGMLSSAEQLFVELLAQDIQGERLAQVRYYLAKTNYLNGRYQQAERFLNQALAYLPSELQDDAYLMQGQLALNKEQLTPAQAAFEKISPNSQAGRFAQFNLGLIYLQQENVEPAIELFDQIAPLANDSEVSKSLYDRANLALGYYFLQQKNSSLAKSYLFKVRLDSLFSNRALLALGWTFLEEKELAKAITYWQELLKGDGRDPAVQEAAMAIAFAYYENGAKKEALESFVTAAALFGEQLTIIAAANDDIEQSLFDRWLQSQTGQGERIFQRWFTGDVPITGHAIEYYIQEVVASNEFNQFFHRFQEMSHLNNVLIQWSIELPVYEQMLSNHQQRYQIIEPKVLARVKLAQSGNFSQQFEQLASEAERRLREDDVTVLADEEELELFNDLARLRGSIDKVEANGEDMSEQREQLRRVYGALLWQQWSNYGPKSYHVKKSISQARAALDNFAKQTNDIAVSQNYAKNRFNNYDRRIEAIRNKIDGLVGQINISRDKARVEMKRILAKVLDKRKQELDFLLAQTELSIAKIQDEAVDLILKGRQ
ncbi:MAG: tetratricopeptide repeat protein [Kangiellaceae bacterium]|jgi:tetratricopeptide (TPR) repeat protein|nr:tetratricopeptide repeat protein [Kangiellaceae bacterium]